MSDSFRTMIVPASQVVLARSLAAALGPGGERMWITGLSLNGAAPATWFISTGGVPEQFAVLMPLQIWEWSEAGAWVQTSSVAGNPAALHQIVLDAGVECTLVEIEALFAAVDVTEQEPFVALGRMGLKIVQPVEI